MISSLLFFKLFILFLPTQLSLHFWPDMVFVNGIRIDYLAPTIYFTDFLLILLIVLWIKKRGARKIFTQYYKYIILFFLIAIVNILFSQIPLLSLYKWVRIGEGLLLFIYIRNQKKVLSKIQMPLLVSLIFTSVLSALQIINNGSLSGAMYLLGERAFTQNTPGIALANIVGNEVLRPYATFPHPNVMAGYALVSFYLFSQLKWRFSLVGKILSVFLIVISYSQNAWMAFSLAPIIVYIINKLKISSLKFIVISTVSSFFLTIMNTSWNATREVLQRIELNVSAGKIISIFPLFGVGTGAFISALPMVEEAGLVRWLQPVHNMFLLISAEMGIIGLLIFICFLFINTNKYNLLPVTSIILLSMWDHYFVTILQTSLLFFIVLGYNGENNKNENIL